MAIRLIAAWIITVALLLLPPAAAAQTELPQAGSVAVGGDVGFYVPRLGFNVSAALDAFGEFYVTPRISVRAIVGWANPGFDTSEATETTLRHTRVLANVLYNWEGNEWHPFVVGGLGAYFLQPRLEGVSVGDSERKIGANLGAGIEYFARRTITFKAEASYHFIGHEETARDPSGLTLTAGLKKYF